MAFERKQKIKATDAAAPYAETMGLPITLTINSTITSTVALTTALTTALTMAPMFALIIAPNPLNKILDTQ